MIPNGLSNRYSEGGSVTYAEHNYLQELRSVLVRGGLLIQPDEALKSMEESVDISSGVSETEYNRIIGYFFIGNFEV